jgi:hypothetical protein
MAVIRHSPLALCVLPLLVAVAADLQAAQESLPGATAAHSAKFKALLRAWRSRSARLTRGARQGVGRQGAFESSDITVGLVPAAGAPNILVGAFEVFDGYRVGSVVQNYFFSGESITGIWTCSCGFPANVTEPRLFEGARPKLQTQGAVSAECYLIKYIFDTDDFFADTTSCSATLTGGAVQCATAQPPTAVRSTSTPTQLIVIKERRCDAEPTAVTLTLKCGASAGPPIPAVHELTANSLYYYLRSVKPRGKPTPSP